MHTKSHKTGMATWPVVGQVGATHIVGVRGGKGVLIPNTLIGGGTQGPAGPQGPTGVSGADGAQGIQGIQGVAGVSGADGAQGAQGVSGAQGIQGPAGVSGVDGVQGVQGTAGVTGAQGVQGIAGVTGDPGGGAANTGAVILNFGAFPGVSDFSVFVTASAIGSGAIAQAWVRPSDTADHTVDEHWCEGIKILAGSVVSGSGFTIYGRADGDVPRLDPPPMGRGSPASNTDVPRRYGQWGVAWQWS